MKGVKRRFANVRNIALFISIFMFISLFSNITVKADELENGEVNPVVSEQAELQSNEEFDTENELLIPEETTDYDDAQNDEVTSADLTGSGEELSEESKEELPTAEEANKQEEWVVAQIKAALDGLTAEQVSKLVIAYEPIWAIGTGKTASADQAEEMCKTIRETVKDLYNEETAENVRIQYGSVKPANVKELMSKPDIDGGLVGGASLDPESFLALVNYQD